VVLDKHLVWFNEKAVVWEGIATEETKEKLRRIVQELKIAPGSTVLDGACGTGSLLRWLARGVAPGGRVAAMDFSPEMISRARAKRFPSTVELLVADVHQLPFAGGAFDEVVCNSAFPHFTDNPRAMREMARVLKKGGRLTICHPSPRDELNVFHKNLGGAVGGDMLPPADEMEQMAGAAGLERAAIEDGPDRYVFTAYRGPALLP
jgi:ubiquinone/menaquinone biosynthesis C-methylase UbiE